MTSLWNNNIYGHYDPYGWYNDDEPKTPPTTNAATNTAAGDPAQLTSVILVAGLIPVGLELLSAIAITQTEDELDAPQWALAKWLSIGSSLVKSAGIIAYNKFGTNLMDFFPLATAFNILNLYFVRKGNKADSGSKLFFASSALSVLGDGILMKQARSPIDSDDASSISTPGPTEVEDPKIKRGDKVFYGPYY